MVLACLALTGGCRWLRDLTYGQSYQVVHKGSHLTLAWDPPVSDIPNEPTEVASYQVYSRQDDSPHWRYLGEVPGVRHPEYTVEHRLLGDGLYEFAVRAITVGGHVSPLHTSLDSSADPICGWLVLWLGPND